MQKYLLLDIQKNNWLFERDTLLEKGVGSKKFIEFLNTFKKEIHIIHNCDFKIIENFFKENNLSATKDYNIILKGRKNKVTIKGITYFLSSGKRIYFRHFKNFSGNDDNLLNNLNINIKIMKEELNELKNLIKNENFYKHYSLFDVIYQDFKNSLNWQKNFHRKISQMEYNYFQNWVNGAYVELNPKYKNQIVENTTVVDMNAAYWYFETLSIPYGYPIYDCDVENCKHNFSLLKIQLTAKVKPNHLPIINKKNTIQYINRWDFLIATPYLKDIKDETIFVTKDKFFMILDYYNIVDIQILDYICFKTKPLAKGFAEKWYEVKEACKSKGVKKIIKNSGNIIIGMQAMKRKTIDRPIFGLDAGGNINIKIHELRIDDKPYIPLQIFITDSAKNYMFKIAQKYRKNFISVSTDAFHFHNLNIKKFSAEYEINAHKLGAFKTKETYKYYYYQGANYYFATDNLNEKGGIRNYLHSGMKAFDITNLSFNDLINIIEKENIKKVS